LDFVARLRVLTRRVARGEYVGIDVAARNLRLYLGDGHTFWLRLAVWDPVVGTIISHREISGHWRRTWDGLELHSLTHTLEYERSRKQNGVLLWRRSTLPTFADGFSLMPAAESNTSLLDIARDTRGGSSTTS
jgi:hypothetical protein